MRFKSNDTPMKPCLTVFLVVAILSSCNFNSECLSKEAFLSGYEKFSNDVEKHYRDLKADDWVDIDKELKVYVEQCYPKYKEELSIEEKVSFWKNTLSYGLYRGDKSNSYQMDLDIDYEKELDELTEQGRMEIERFFQKELKPELNDIIDEVVKEVDNLGGKLKEWLNDN